MRSASKRTSAQAWQALAGLTAGHPEGYMRTAAGLLKVRDRTGTLCALVANPAQVAFERSRGRHNIVLKARQMGMTTWVAGRFFLRTILQAGTNTLLVAHTRAASEAIFRTVQRMWEELPEDLKDGVLRRSRANVGQMIFPALDSEFRVGSACDPNAGRGMSLRNLLCSEVARWPGHAAETLAGLRAALAPDGELVLESTPNGAYGAFHEEWTRGDATMVRHFLPWWMEAAYRGEAVEPQAMTATESGLVQQHGLTAGQVGFRRGLERRYGALRSQEFAEDAETCFRATGDCCFEVSAIEARLVTVGRPLMLRHNGALEIFLPPAAGRRYVLGVDTAGGGEDGDFAAVQVVEVSTGLQCAELRARLRPAELAREVAQLAVEYGDAVVAVERNNHGAAVLAYLETAERGATLWRARDGRPGWLTTSVSKPEMIARLGAWVLERPETLQSRRLLSECRTFVAGEGNRQAAASGAHDDLVMAMAVALSVRAELLQRI